MTKLIAWKILFKTLVLLVSLVVFSYLTILKISYGLLVLPLIVYQIYSLIVHQKLVYNHLYQFTEAIKNGDYSTRFSQQSSSVEYKMLNKTFSDITSILKKNAKDKELQYQYLHHILEILDTGIISYDNVNGNIIWMNSTFKKMLNLPHLKNIQNLNKRNVALFKEITELKLKENKVITINQGKDEIKMLISLSIFNANNVPYRLLTFKNISEALEESEADAWSRLLRVLTHEIMNSIAPISSLADTLNSLIEISIHSSEAQPSYQEDLTIGINTILKRSQALMVFADNYRGLSKINSLHRDKVYLRNIFENQSSLMGPTLSKKNIEFDIIMKDPSIQVLVDSNLIEQVIINLIVNAIDAVQSSVNPRITLSAERNTIGFCIIQVQDNGTGISYDLLDKIFVPFFSTKKNGSGIGLNLCKQIMLLHKGSINVQTIEGFGSCFSLTIPS